MSFGENAFCGILLLIGLGLGYLSFPQDVLQASLTGESFLVLGPSMLEAMRRGCGGGGGQRQRWQWRQWWVQVVATTATAEGAVAKDMGKKKQLTKWRRK
jgi:hypothetical protein